MAVIDWRGDPFKIKSISRFKVDLVASFAGTGWAAAVQVACIPLYIKFLGIEAYGLIGFYLMLQSMLQVLDLGLSPTMNREMARYSIQPEKSAEARDLVRTLEVGYWLIGIAIGAVIVTAAPAIAKHWIKSGSFPVHDVQVAVMLMGVLSVFQWPTSFYQGGLIGLGQQVRYNGLAVFFTTVSNGGAIALLWHFAPTIQMFFLWLVVVNACKAVVLANILWTSLPSAGRSPRFDFSRVRAIRGFAAGMSGITLTSLLLTQIDKLLVSKLLSLKTLGYYTLAWTVASGFSLISGALFNVIFPRLSAQVAKGDEQGIRISYHRGSQLMAVIITPVAAVLCFFSFDLLRLWTRSTSTASATAPILRVLVIGSALNALLFLPYALQLAFGWTRLTLVMGLVSVAVVVPMLFPMTKYFGAVGAAAVWAGLNIANMLVAVPIMHRRLLRREVWGYFGDIALPLISVVAVAALGRMMVNHPSSPFATIAVLSSLWMVSVLMAVLAAPRIRSWALGALAEFGLRRWSTFP